MENKNKVQDSVEESQEGGWDSMGDWSEVHPFKSNQESRLPDGEESDSRLARIRQKQVEYLRSLEDLGEKYEPTLEDLDEFYADEGFYESDEYKKYKEEKFERLKGKYADVFDPSDESIQFKLDPFLKSIEDDVDKLMGLGARMEKGGYKERDVKKIMEFFADKFGITDVPGVKLVGDGGASDEKTRGHYDRANHEVMVLIDKTRTVADLVHVIAHEMWHAYQVLHEADEEGYQVNFAYFREPSVDYNAYRNQLVEKEAFYVGDTVGELYRRVDLEEHPEKIPALSKKYREYCLGDYDPNETEDGIDLEYLCLADSEYERYMSESLRGNKRKIFELNDEYEIWASRADPSEVWEGTDYRALIIAHKEYERLNDESRDGRKKSAPGIFERIFRREKK